MNVVTWQDIGYFTRVCDFFDNARAIQLSHNHIRFLLSRRNSMTGRIYGEDPTIMSWQLAHEPRPLDNRGPFIEWAQETSRLIKKLAPHHMVTIGSEGAHAGLAQQNPMQNPQHNSQQNPTVGHPAPGWSPWDPDTSDFEQAHSSSKDIDYATVNLWPEQWGWVHGVSEQTWMERVKQYLEAHIDAAMRIGKPLVIQDVGMPRDGGSYLETSRTHNRDTLLSIAFAVAQKSMSDNPRGVISGVTFGSWAGDGRKVHGLWEQGDPLIGEPPHEYQVFTRHYCVPSAALCIYLMLCCWQGCNSIYSTDLSTIQIISKFAQRFQHILPGDT